MFDIITIFLRGPVKIMARVYNRRGESVALLILCCMSSLAKVHDLSLVFVQALKPQVCACVKLQLRAVRVTLLCTVHVHALW